VNMLTMQLAWRILVVTIAFGAASAIGWWALPIAAAVFGAITHLDRGGPLVAGIGGMLSWAVILVYDAARGPVATVAATLGGVLQIKPIAVYVLTLSFAGLLAVCAAIVARSVARVFVPEKA